jgi:hypothetical protein
MGETVITIRLSDGDPNPQVTVSRDGDFEIAQGEPPVLLLQPAPGQASRRAGRDMTLSEAAAVLGRQAALSRWRRPRGEKTLRFEGVD